MMRNLPIITRRAMLSMALLLGLFTAQVEAAGDVEAPVRKFQEALLHIMKQGPTLGFEGRKQYLAPVIDQAFDLRHISRAIIGRYWKNLTVAERRHLADRIRDYALATLASRFSEADGETFVMGPQSAVGDKAMRVKSRFTGPDTDVSLDYLVRRDSHGDWRVSNVWFDGVSGTDIQQQEFASFLRKGGAEGLIVKLDEVILGLSQEG